MCNPSGAGAVSLGMDNVSPRHDQDDAGEPRPRLLWRLAARIGTAIAVGLALVVERRPRGGQGRLREGRLRD